jgi:acetyltransferase-like isoleucine patch superfamily enzyme
VSEGTLRGLRALLAELRDLGARRRLLEQLRREHDGLRIGRGVDVRSPERLTLGRRVVLDVGVVLHCGGMAWSGGAGGITIGDDTYVGPHAVLFGAGGIIIESGVLVSPGVVITSHQHSFARTDQPIREQPTSFEPVVIESNVWIGSNATILPGVRLGAGSVIGAGAVVTRDVGPRVVAVGVPARVQRQR